jgi:hypothetical protein
MSKSSLSPVQSALVWIRAGGRCQFPGCNRRLDIDSVIKQKTNVGEKAHIVADSERGPRGDANFSAVLGRDIANILLLCEEHHKLIDGPDQSAYDVRLLRQWKDRQEARVRRALDMDFTNESTVLAFHDRIGAHDGVFDAKALNQAVVLNSGYSVFPDRDQPVRVNGDALPFDDHDKQHWDLRQAAISKVIEHQLVAVAGAMPAIQHLSVFALAPMPDLMMLGKALGDKRPVNVFQYDRVLKSWLWPAPDAAPPNYRFSLPDCVSGELAIDLSLSFDVDRPAIERVVPGMPLARFYVEAPTPHLVQGPAALASFGIEFRRFLSEINHRFGRVNLHLFPAAPASTCVELGRLLLPKGDNRLTVWEYQRDSGGFRFVEAVTL